MTPKEVTDFFPKSKKNATREPEEHDIYNALINTSSRRAIRYEKNVAMALIDYQKAYDIVPQNWIIDYLRTYKISDKVIKFITEAMKLLQMNLIAGEEV